MAVTGAFVERFAKDGPITMTVGVTPVVAGNIVEFSGDRTIIPAATGSVKVAGVAGQTGSATGDKIDVHNEGYFTLTANGAIAAGDTLAAGAVAGTVRKWVAADTAEAIIGRACQAIADTAKGLCYLDTV